jgi:hypothetical protein
VGATIKGTFDMCGAKIFSCDRDALNLNRAEIAGDLLVKSRDVVYDVVV